MIKKLFVGGPKSGQWLEADPPHDVDDYVYRTLGEPDVTSVPGNFRDVTIYVHQKYTLSAHHANSAYWKTLAGPGIDPDPLIVSAWHSRRTPWYVIQKLDIPNTAKMSLLALCFHVFAERDGLVCPWEPKKLHQWATASGEASPAAELIVSFLLSVWNSEPYDAAWPANAKNNRWWPNLKHFNVALARQLWDGQHWDAFTAWVNYPWTA